MSSEKNNLRILLVEDDALVRLTGRRLLEGLGCFVTEADSCREGLGLWSASEFDLVFMDYRLDDGLGIDVVREARTLGHDEPVVFLTAETEEITDEIRRELAATAVAKPLEEGELTAAVESVKGCLEGAAASSQAGRFRIIRCPDVFHEIPEDEVDGFWIALDMSSTAKAEGSVYEKLRKLAASCRAGQGRLCVVGLSPDLKAEFVTERMQEDVDILDEIRDLDAEGRRLASGSERSMLMDSIVRQDS